MPGLQIGAAITARAQLAGARYARYGDGHAATRSRDNKRQGKALK
jgi:hypothetical protein